MSETRMSGEAVAGQGASAKAVVPPTHGMRTFLQVLANTAIANITTSYLWWALTFWVYLETRSVLATGVIGGAYMLLVALFSIVFGTIVDRHRKFHVMVLASVVTLASFLIAGVLYVLLPESELVNLGGPIFWLFAGIILFGSVVENMRNIALSTTVTLLVPDDRHANANGLVGTVQGVAFIITSVFSGLSVGLLGMGWTLLIAIVMTGVALLHLMFLRIPEERPKSEDGARPNIDLRGSIVAIRSAPGLFGLIIFSTFNNLIGGAYMALMDPYGLEMFPVELWGLVFGVASTGFVVGGLVVAKFGLGRNPVRTMLLVVFAMGLLGALFTIREWWVLFAVGIWFYMALFPAVEAAEQTVIQRVVPFPRQGRVFGFAQAFESAAAPITAFLVAPIAEFMIIPYMRQDVGRSTWGWLLGDGQARGIALVFLVAGVVMMLLVVAAFFSRSYRRLSQDYQSSVPAEDSAPEATAPEGSPQEGSPTEGGPADGGRESLSRK